MYTTNACMNFAARGTEVEQYMNVSSTLTPPKDERKSSQRSTVLWVIAAIIPIVAIVAFGVFQPVKVRPRIGLAPGYAFTNQNGAQLTSEDMRGKLVFYSFTYTGCQKDCPQTTETMAAIRSLSQKMDTAGLPVQFVTISFDPERDTPDALRQYAAQIDPALNAEESSWHFVTGSAERVKNVVGGGFHVFYQPNGQGGFTFDPTIVMVDGNGIIRAIYERTMPDMQTVERDLKLLVNEVKNSEGPGKLVYEAAHLFLCYPPS